MADILTDSIQSDKQMAGLPYSHPHAKSQIDDKEGRQDSFEVVEFLLGQEHFAINLYDVKEVVEYTRITRLPNSPPYINGIIDLRGQITTIINLKLQLAISTEGDSREEDSRIIVLDDRLTKSKIGIMVDDVLSVSTYTKTEVDGTATSGDEGTHIIGIIKKMIHDKEKEKIQLIIWLDVQKLIREMEEK